MSFLRWLATRTRTRVDGLLLRSPDVLAATQGDAVVLLDLKGERYYTLNAVGGTVWGALAAGATVPELVAAVRREYDVPDGGLVTRDVARLVGDLRAAGLVVTRRAGGGRR